MVGEKHTSLDCGVRNLVGWALFGSWLGRLKTIRGVSYLGIEHISRNFQKKQRRPKNSCKPERFLKVHTVILDHRCFELWVIKTQ